MSTTTATTKEQFARLLPILQHVAHFPTCNLFAACRRRSFDSNEVARVLEDLAGGQANWDVETLDDCAAQFGVAVPPFRAAALPAVTAAKPGPIVRPPSRAANEGELSSWEIKGARAGSHYLRKVTPEAAVGSPAKPKRAPRRDLGRSDSRRHDYLAICRILLNEPTLNEAQACSRHGLRQGTWSAFKVRTFGKGALDRGRLPNVIATLARDLGEKLEVEPAKSPAKRPTPSPENRPAVNDLGAQLYGAGEWVEIGARGVDRFGGALVVYGKSGAEGALMLSAAAFKLLPSGKSFRILHHARGGLLAILPGGGLKCEQRTAGSTPRLRSRALRRALGDKPLHFRAAAQAYPGAVLTLESYTRAA